MAKPKVSNPFSVMAIKSYFLPMQALSWGFKIIGIVLDLSSLMPQDFPDLPPLVPQRGTAYSRALCRKLFIAQGWKVAFIILPMPLVYRLWCFLSIMSTRPSIVWAHSPRQDTISKTLRKLWNVMRAISHQRIHTGWLNPYKNLWKKTRKLRANLLWCAHLFVHFICI